jgi:alanine racemase
MMAVEGTPFRPAWVEVDLQAIEQNTHRLIEIIGPEVELLAMVKANGYGHGAVEASRAALRGGATWLGVVSVGEGIELRRAGIDARILVVGTTLPDKVRAGVEYDLTLTVFSSDTLRAVQDSASTLGRRACVHLKIDTGMARLGVLPEDALEFAQSIGQMGNVTLEGIFTHFAMADTPDAFGIRGWGEKYTHDQLERFLSVIDTLEGAEIHPQYRHCANSPASVNIPEARFNLVRSGILIYGLEPSDESPRPRGFKPALAFKTRVALVKQVPAGTYVSYGATFLTVRPSRLAVIMVGYADGFRRKPGNYSKVLVRGQRATIVGRVSMDQAIIDATDIEGVLAGDEVVLIGKQGTEEITAEEVANNLGTNNYETITTISARLERRYL